MMGAASPGTYRMLEHTSSSLSTLEEFIIYIMYVGSYTSIFIHRVTPGAQYPQNCPGVLLQGHLPHSFYRAQNGTNIHAKGINRRQRPSEPARYVIWHVKRVFERFPLLQPPSAFHKNITSKIPLHRWENKGTVSELIWWGQGKTSSDSGKRTPNLQLKGFFPDKKD